MTDEASVDQAELAAIVAALAPTGSGPANRSKTAAGRAAEELLGPGATAWTAQLAGELTEGIQGKHPDESVPVDDIAIQGEILILRILLQLAGAGSASSAVAIVGTTDETIRKLIAIGVPFGRIGETVRLAHELLVRALLGVAIDGRATAATLTTITLAVTRSMDDALDSMAKQYVAEKQRFSLSVTRAQQELIDRLITGSPVDTRGIRRVLALSIDDYHLGFVISRVASSTHLDQQTLRRPLEVIKHGLHVSEVVVREHRDSVWVWASAQRPLRINELDLATEIGTAVQVGVGSAQPGAAGFRRTHLEAAAANRFGQHVPCADVIDYTGHALAILLSADPERARWFVESELGELAVSNPRNRELLKTLRCYFDSKLRIAVAAEQLHVHRNTAIARLNSLELMLGHSVTDRMAELQAALSVLEFVEGTEASVRA